MNKRKRNSYIFIIAGFILFIFSAITIKSDEHEQLINLSNILVILGLGLLWFTFYGRWFIYLKRKSNDAEKEKKLIGTDERQQIILQKTYAKMFSITISVFPLLIIMLFILREIYAVYILGTMGFFLAFLFVRFFNKYHREM